MFFKSLPQVSTTFTFLFCSGLVILFFPATKGTVARFASWQVVVSGGFAAGVFVFWEDRVGRCKGGVLCSYRRLDQDGSSLGLMGGDLVDKSLQHPDCLRVVGQV